MCSCPFPKIRVESRIYKKYVGDGDSKSYVFVKAAQPYGCQEFIEKAESISHIAKRM